MKKFVFRIRRRYLVQIMNRPGVDGHDPAKPTKDVEYRRDSPHWQKLVFGVTDQKYMSAMQHSLEEKTSYFRLPVTLTERDIQKWGGAMAVFICGKTVYRHPIVQIDRMPTPATFSLQGKKDVDTPTCFAFHLEPEKFVAIKLSEENIEKLENLAKEKGLKDVNEALEFLLDNMEGRLE